MLVGHTNSLLIFPGVCMRLKFMFLSILILGPYNPGRNIDVYLQLLIN